MNPRHGNTSVADASIVVWTPRQRPTLIGVSSTSATGFDQRRSATERTPG